MENQGGKEPTKNVSSSKGMEDALQRRGRS